MGVVQLGLVMLALAVCSYDNVLQECLDDQGVDIIFEVVSQLSESGAISTMMRVEIETLLTNNCRNASNSSNFPRLAEFTDETDCIDAIMNALGRIPEFNVSNHSTVSLRKECPDLFYRGWLNVGLVGFAAFIMIVLSFTKKRHHFAKHIFHGYPGVIIPVNLLQSRQSYFIHVIIFGAMAGDILSNIFNPSTDFIADVYDTAWSSSLIFYVQVMLQTLYFAPLLVCTHTPVKLLGFSFGLLYALYFTAIRVMHLEILRTNCVFFRGNLSHLYPLVEFPTYICMLIVCAWYAYKTMVSAYEMHQWYVNGRLRRTRTKTQYFIRVKKLLMRSLSSPQGDDSEQKCNKIVSFIQKYTCDSSFHYPLGFSSAVLIALICIFQLTFLLILISLEGTRWLHDSLKKLENLLELIESPRIDINFYGHFEDAALFLEVTVPLVPLIAGIFCYVLLFLLVINVREDIKRLYAGDTSVFPKKKPTPTNMLASGLRYMGYQVGFFVWTWVIALLILYLVVLLAFVYVLLLRIDTTATINWTFLLIIPTIISTVLRYAQIYFARFVFLQDRGATLSLTNIHGFHWFQFMMIFFNVVVGLTSALLRNIYSLVFGLLLMPRLDRTVMMKGFERWDSGYRTYIGFLYMNLYHNNSIVNTFCLLLHNTLHPMIIRKSIRNSHEELDEIITQLNAALKDGSDHKVNSKVSFNRWHLAYTLMKNPQLKELRGHYIAAKKAEDQMVTAKLVNDKEMEAFNEETNSELRLVNINRDSVVDDIEIETSTREINNTNCELQVVQTEEESVVDDKEIKCNTIV